ncbi:hypothetical protein SYNPS1DRAFT_29376, partial [Syncephalis pseudoplumigaleata]
MSTTSVLMLDAKAPQQTMEITSLAQLLADMGEPEANSPQENGAAAVDSTEPTATTASTSPAPDAAADTMAIDGVQGEAAGTEAMAADQKEAEQEPQTRKAQESSGVPTRWSTEECKKLVEICNAILLEYRESGKPNVGDRARKALIDRADWEEVARRLKATNTSPVYRSANALYNKWMSMQRIGM